MSRPEVTPFAEAAYARLAPIARLDESLGWPLLHFVNGVAQMFRPVEELVRGDTEHEAGSQILDVDRTPTVMLPFVGQIVGVAVNPGSSPDAARVQIRRREGFNRGKIDSLVAAVETTLEGNPPHVFVRERDGAPANLTVVTRTDQTPDPARTLAVATAAKAAGRILALVTTNVLTYAEHEDAHVGTYAAIEAAIGGTYSTARGY